MADTVGPATGALNGPAGEPPATASPPEHDAPQEASSFATALAERPWEHGFFPALRRLEAQHRGRPRLGRSTRPADDPFRLGQEPAVDFAPATLAEVEPGTVDGPLRLTVRFFGLFGPDGPLPLHLTDHARDRQRHHRDPTFRRFADIFHHRALSLLYRAWADSQPTASFDRPEDDRFSGYVASLIGLGGEALRDRDAMPDLSKLHFAGHFAGQTRHAEGLASILSSFFAVPVRVECFVGDWLTLPAPDHTILGSDPRTAELGSTVLLGGRVWSRQHKFRLVFGPLGLADYERLLPGGSSFRRLIPVVRNYAGDTLGWDCNLVLQREELPRIALGQAGRLGWTTWLTPYTAPHDAADLFLDSSADSSARAADASPPHAPESLS